MDVRLPKLGEGAESGVVVALFVKEGEAIKQGQTLLELENEKAVAPIPSPAEGKVAKVHVKEGDKISVGQLIVSLAGGESSAGTPPPEPAAPKAAPEVRGDAAKPAPAPETRDGKSFAQTSAAKAGFPPPAAPSVRKLARDLGIDLTRIRGSEAGGRIVLEDLRAYVQFLQAQAFHEKPAEEKRPAAPPPERVDFSKWGPVEKKPLTALRKTISRRMLESWTAIPHVTQFDEADLTRVNELRKKHAPAYEKREARLTFTPFALKAVATVLKKHPIFNSSVDESSQELVLKQYIHIGLAVDTEAGLIVPVIRDVDKKPLEELAREVNALAEKARDRKISAEELKGGSFTISNQGGIGGGPFTPIINRPEVAILGLGRGVVKPVARENKIEARLMLPLCLSYDHRVIDGGSAARFIVELVQAFESFPEAEVQLA